MKKFLTLLLVVFLSACVQVGEFTPERHAQHETGRPDCNITPERCINGVPW